jgi:hypothetical protein
MAGVELSLGGHDRTGELRLDEAVRIGVACQPLPHPANPDNGLRMRFQKNLLALTFLLPLVLWTSTGCDDFATPAELERPQILGIASDPASIDEGESATLTILVADSAGEVETPTVMWDVVPPAPNTLPIGSVDVASDGTVTYTAPDSVAQNPTIAQVQATVVTPDQEPLVALKGMLITSVLIGNPTISELSASGASTSDLLSDDLMMSTGTPITLEVATVPGLGEDARFAWYSTIGEIEQYQSNPTELVAEEAGDGWLFVVVRDGSGGIAWHKVRVQVQ